jgi:hypothetical protein
LQNFATRFPEPTAMTNLDYWHEFETQAPSTFTAMYQFWVHKPATVRSDGITGGPSTLEQTRSAELGLNRD